MEYFKKTDDTIRFTVSTEETMNIHGFPNLGYYALICADGKVVLGQWLNETDMNMIEHLPPSYYAGEELALLGLMKQASTLKNLNSSGYCASNRLGDIAASDAAGAFESGSERDHASNGGSGVAKATFVICQMRRLAAHLWRDRVRCPIATKKHFCLFKEKLFRQNLQNIVWPSNAVVWSIVFGFSTQRKRRWQPFRMPAPFKR